LTELSHRVLARDPSADGVFISCGGLSTLDVIPPLEVGTGKPATASSPAGFWDVMRLAGLDAASPGFGRLFGGEHAAVLRGELRQQSGSVCG